MEIGVDTGIEVGMEIWKAGVGVIRLRVGVDVEVGVGVNVVGIGIGVRWKLGWMEVGVDIDSIS